MVIGAIPTVSECQFVAQLSSRPAGKKRGATTPDISFLHSTFLPRATTARPSSKTDRPDGAAKSAAMSLCATARTYRGSGLLLRHHSSRRGARRLFRRRDHKCDPGVPAVRSILCGEFLVAFDVEVALRRGGQGNDEPELRAHTDHLGLEATHPIAGAAVATQLSVDVADETGLKLFGQELRRAPIEMHVDAVLILRRLIGEIVGEAEHAGEFVPGLRIEIGVAAAGVDSAVPDADI